MGIRASAAFALSLVIGTAGCSSSAATEDSATAGASASAARGRVGPADDAAAMGDLRASEKWTMPSCRWLESGAWVLASEAEEALYRAASQMNYIEMTQVGQEFHFNRQAPALRIVLTNGGKAASAKCGPTSTPTSWGVPVAERRFISGKFAQQQPSGWAVYEVDFSWVPTPVGDQVMSVLTNRMAVPSGAYRVKVTLEKRRASGAGAWTVMSIDDRGAVRQ